MLNNETTYSNGEFHFFSKCPLMQNQISILIKHVINCNNWIGGYCITNFERDEKSFKSMLTLESFTWKVGEDLYRPLTYWIGSKC